MKQQELEMLRAQLEDMAAAHDIASIHIEHLELQLHAAMGQIEAQVGEGQRVGHDISNVGNGDIEVKDNQLQDDEVLQNMARSVPSGARESPTNGGADVVIESRGRVLENVSHSGAVSKESLEGAGTRALSSAIGGDDAVAKGAVSTDARRIAPDPHAKVDTLSLEGLLDAQERVAAAESRLQATEASLATLQEQLSDAHRQVKQARDRAVAAEHQGQTAVTMVASLQRGMEEAGMHAEKQEAFVRTLEEQLAAFQAAQQAHADAVAGRQQDGALREKLREAEEAKCSLGMRVRELEDEVAAAVRDQGSRDALRKGLQAAEGRACELEGQVAALTNELQHAEEQLISVRDDAKELAEARLQLVEELRAAELGREDALRDSEASRVRVAEVELHLSQDLKNAAEVSGATEGILLDARKGAEAGTARVTEVEQELHEVKQRAEASWATEVDLMEARKESESAKARVTELESQLELKKQEAVASVKKATSDLQQSLRNVQAQMQARVSTL